MSLRIFGPEEGDTPAPKVSPESFSVIYEGEVVSRHGPYLYNIFCNSSSLIADLGTCADTICGDQEALFEFDRISQTWIDCLVVNLFWPALAGYMITILELEFEVHVIGIGLGPIRPPGSVYKNQIATLFLLEKRKTIGSVILR